MDIVERLKNVEELNSNQKALVTKIANDKPALSGYFKRKFIRKNTVHIVGKCPQCGKKAFWSKSQNCWICDYKNGHPMKLVDILDARYN